MPARRRSRPRTTRSPASKPRSAETNASSRGLPSAGPRYRFVGGKGGVGKTTCAAGIAVSAAAAGDRTLVISTDPAHSLGDAFGEPLGGVPRSIAAARGSLQGVEVDAPRALERWLSSRRAALERIALRGTWLDRDDVSSLLRLSLPGIDELAALFEISRFARTARYDLIVVDTAPTGHTLRMLTTPGTLRGIARVFDHMQSKHRAMVDALRGSWTPEAEDAVIDALDREGEDLAALLADATRSRLSWVTLPEPMAVEETLAAAAAMAAQGLHLQDVIVNRITPAPDRPCGWCDARRVLERRTIRDLRSRLPHAPLIAVKTRDAEPRGLRALAGIGSELAAAAPPQGTVRSGRARWRAAAPSMMRGDVLAALSGSGTRLVLFGGKGGVGKTTSAAAAAVAMAARNPQQRVLLLSTDPAHSLGHVFGTTVSDVGGPAPGGPPNLAVREIDAAAAFRHVRDRYETAIDALFDRLNRGGSSSGVDASHDRRVMHGLIDLAPPGIDELAAVIDVTDTLDAGADDRADAGSHAADLVVMDTAPSGHALRLLEMPALIHDWTRALMSILLKYQPIAGVGELGAVLLKLSRGIGRLRALLSDPGRTSFVGITRAAALPRAETLRLVTRLRRMKVHMPVILVNAMGRGTCRRCRRAAAAEDREMLRLRRSVQAGRGAVRLWVAPGELPPPHGVRALLRWQREWRVDAAGRPRR